MWGQGIQGARPETSGSGSVALPPPAASSRMDWWEISTSLGTSFIHAPNGIIEQAAPLHGGWIGRPLWSLVRDYDATLKVANPLEGEEAVKLSLPSIRQGKKFGGIL